MALLGTLAALLFPATVPLVWLALVGVPANGPLSPILPTLWEPVLMEVAKYSHPAWVTSVGLAIYMYMEFINWQIYSWVLARNRLQPVRENRWVRWGVRSFAKAPYATVFFFAASPLPFWVVRSLAILKQYPLNRYMTATAMGRVPRFFLYAWLGAALKVPLLLLAGVIVLGSVFAVAVRLAHGRPLLPEPVEQLSPAPESVPESAD